MSQIAILVPRPVSKIWKKPKEGMFQIRPGSDNSDLNIKTITQRECLK